MTLKIKLSVGTGCLVLSQPGYGALAAGLEWGRGTDPTAVGCALHAASVFLSPQGPLPARCPPTSSLRWWSSSWTRCRYPPRSSPSRLAKLGENGCFPPRCPALPAPVPWAVVEGFERGAGSPGELL